MSRNRLELDFSGHRRRAPGLGIVLLLVGAVLALLSTVRLADALAARAAYNGSLAELEAATVRTQAKPVAKGPADPRTTARRVASKQVAQSLQSPWADVLDAIEVKPNGNVALLSVEPSAIKRTVRITAEARDADAMIEHLGMLQQDARLTDVALVSHQRLVAIPGAPWRYQIQGTW